MIRTRDYLLFLIIIVFLLVGIGGTLIDRYAERWLSDERPIEFADDTPTDFVAVADNDLESKRQERLATLRQKVADSANLLIMEEPEEIPDEVATSTDEDTSDEQVTTVQQCPNYRQFAAPWNAIGLEFRVMEGARVLFRTDAKNGTSTETALLYLPLASQPSPTTSCLETDVIGLTMGGTLIKNTDAALYKAAGENTLLGYALDGFPIYGTTNGSLDACGGQMVAGQYRYQLSAAHDTILRCFAGNPVPF